MGDDAVARGWYRNDPRLFVPGMAWYNPGYHDPAYTDPDEMERVRQGLAADTFLSVHYWKDWSVQRASADHGGPNGREWCVDQKSSNGTGWVVTGELPKITCHPSIVVPGYHGFLVDGVFTDDVDGRGPNGVAG
jgi:hypothetical protein